MGQKEKEDVKRSIDEERKGNKITHEGCLSQSSDV